MSSLTQRRKSSSPTPQRKLLKSIPRRRVSSVLINSRSSTLEKPLNNRHEEDETSSEQINHKDLRNIDFTTEYKDTDFTNAVFTGYNFAASNFAGIDLSGTIFDDADLENVNFENANLEYVNFKGANLANANFKGANLANANFEGADLSNVNFRGVNLTNVNFEGANLSNTNFKGVNLRNTNFEGANLINANLENTNFRNTNFEGANLKGANLANFTFANEEKIRGSWYPTFKNADLTNAYLAGTDMSQCRLENVIFEGANLEGVNFEASYLTDVNFGEANLNMVNFDGSELNNVNFRKADLQKANFSNVILNDINFEDCDLEDAKITYKLLTKINLKYIDFENANLTRVDLRETILTNANFKNAILKDANLEKVNLINSNLKNADFTNANLKDADLTGANLERTDFTGANLGRANLEETNLFLSKFKNVNLNGTYLGKLFNTERRPIGYRKSAINSTEILELLIDRKEPEESDQTILSCASDRESKIFTLSRRFNPIDLTETCSLLNNKKTKYYIHTYDPTFLENKMSETGLFPSMYDIFDFDIKENCCNCIAISLYYTNTQSLSKCELYLASIRRTVDNVRKNLPDWVVRLYLDSSVYNSMVEFQKTNTMGVSYVKQSLNYLLTADNVEIYLYCCPNILNRKISIARTRTFRFLPLSDQDVNVKIIREADGVVTNVDCHNIKVFAQSEYLFYLPRVVDGYDHINKNKYRAYSTWLTMYVKCLEPEYFAYKQHLYDLLAGTLGFRLMLRRDHYDDQVKIVQNLISIKTDTIPACLRTYNKDIKSLQGTLNTGFDEILLLRIFRDYISCPATITREDDSDIVTYTDLAVKSTIMSFICANHNIVVFKVGKISKNTSSLREAITHMNELELLKLQEPEDGLANLNTVINKLDIISQKPLFPYYYFDSIISAYLDSLMIESNKLTKDAFDLQYNIEGKPENLFLLENLNIGYTTSISNDTSIDVNNIPYYDCVYDFR